MSDESAKHFLSFDEWLTANPELLAAQLKAGVECAACNGMGTLYEDDDLDDADGAVRDHMQRLYQECKRSDQEKIDEWNKIIREET